MPEMNDTQPTLFQRLAQIRAAVERSRADVLRLRRSIRNIGKSTERLPAEDMAIQLNQAAAALDKALLELVVEPWHVDQPLRPALEVVQL
jgi:hypothetical protein